MGTKGPHSDPADKTSVAGFCTTSYDNILQFWKNNATKIVEENSKSLLSQQPSGLKSSSRVSHGKKNTYYFMKIRGPSKVNYPITIDEVLYIQNFFPFDGWDTAK